ncbi:hypothetical protein [Streptomyces pseudovenezuelae]|uniref:hypothetical protein n=1 Tax=Streptomyces pseudovenezuelae TaxID=67350 RepID=UPI002E35B686|nr:hypothetical protein [Streptomyces pseudovenezuelae]
MSLNVGPLEPVTEDDILVVYGYHQARLYPEFPKDRVFSINGLAFMRGIQPRRAFHTGLGQSWQADRMRQELRHLEIVHGTEVRHVDELRTYDEAGSERAAL